MLNPNIQVALFNTIQLIALVRYTLVMCLLEDVVDCVDVDLVLDLGTHVVGEKKIQKDVDKF